MSLSSWHMAFFAHRPLGDWRAALRGVWELLEVDSAYSAFRSIGPCREWAFPEWVLGDYSPSCVTLQVGPHDLYEVKGLGDGTYFGRPSFSLVIFDKRDPKQPAAMRDKVFAVPEVVTLETNLASRFGVIRHVWYWGWKN